MRVGFHLSTDKTDNAPSATITVDEKKIQEDKKKVEDQIQEDKKKVEDFGEKVKKNATGPTQNVQQPKNGS